MRMIKEIITIAIIFPVYYPVYFFASIALLVGYCFLMRWGYKHIKSKIKSKILRFFIIVFIVTLAPIFSLFVGAYVNAGLILAYEASLDWYYGAKKYTTPVPFDISKKGSTAETLFRADKVAYFYVRHDSDIVQDIKNIPIRLKIYKLEKDKEPILVSDEVHILREISRHGYFYSLALENGRYKAVAESLEGHSIDNIPIYFGVYRSYTK